MLDLRQLSYFVAVAEEEHVGRAAARLHLSQSPLSRQIAQLESALGLSLFERRRRRIHLTGEGRAFLVEARALLEQAGRVEALARSLGRGDEGGLDIGYVAEAMHAGVLPAALHGLRTLRPDARIALHGLDCEQQMASLRQRSLDLALIDVWPQPDGPDLFFGHVLGEPTLLAMPAAHPLCAASVLGPAQLRSEPWIAVGRVDSRPGKEKGRGFAAACARAGFSPAVRAEAGDPATALDLVAAGLGLAMVPASPGRPLPPGVVLRPLPCLVWRSSFWVAWRRADTRPLVRLFGQVLLREDSVITKFNQS